MVPQPERYIDRGWPLCDGKLFSPKNFFFTKKCFPIFFSIQKNTNNVFLSCCPCYVRLRHLPRWRRALACDASTTSATKPPTPLLPTSHSHLTRMCAADWPFPHSTSQVFRGIFVKSGAYNFKYTFNLTFT